MQLQLNKPELMSFIDQKVKSGEFPSAEAVVEDAIARMMEEEKLTAEDIKYINEAEDQMDAGQHVEFEKFAAEMRAKYVRR